MDFGFSIEDTATGQSSVLNSAGHRGLQLLAQVSNLGGGEDNRINVSIFAVSPDGTIAQEAYRILGIPSEDTSVILIYPGIAEIQTRTSFVASAVLPARFQVQVSNDDGATIHAVFACTTLP